LEVEAAVEADMLVEAAAVELYMLKIIRSPEWWRFKLAAEVLGELVPHLVLAVLTPDYLQMVRQ
jgi:hypothetical protein